MLEDLLQLKGNGSIPGSDLKTGIRGMKDQGLCRFTGLDDFLVELTCGAHADVIALHIAAQNAGLIMRHMGDEIHFESFELSPRAGNVMGTAGRLTCSFPGPVMAVKATKIQNSAFLDELVSFLEQMNQDVLEDAMPFTIKAGAKVMEERDTAGPMYITAMLAGIFRAIGRPVDDVSRIQKQVRDDVLWSNAKLPWRRSALWLLIRVAIQTTVQGNDGLYKSFMIHLMSQLLDLAKRENLGNETLFVMRAKLSRRVEKADGGLPKSILQGASSVIRSVSDRLREYWESEWERAYHPPNLEGIFMVTDTNISLENGKSYIEEIASRPDLSGSPRGSCPVTTTPRVGSDPNSLPGIPSEVDSRALALALSDFERWVEQSLDGWLKTNICRVEICRQLADSINQYTNVAGECYKSKPDDLSVMLLTAAMLWVALDTAAVRHCPLLRKYRPEVPHDALEPLVLPKKTQMQALYKVEQYILKRELGCIGSNPSIYADDITFNTFAVSYCKDSPSHQALNSRVEEWARKSREEKEEEFRRESIRHQGLLNQIGRTSCECYYNRYRHWQVCRKHQLIEEASSIRIEVHEWPLPENDLHRWVVIFELDCPPAFCAWRDATYKILAEVFAVRPATEPSESGHGNIRLRQHFSDRGQRITLKSSTKSFLNAHYSHRNLPTTIDELCVPSGLKYRLHDGVGWVTKQLGQNDVRSMCTPALPDGIYRSLQWVVQGTTHTPNEVIARQSECHPELLNHEYDTFGLLRSGNRLQWLNIARELRARNLSLGQEAVNVLVLHAAWQAGPSGGSDIRQAHSHLSQYVFGTRLISEMEATWGNIEGNWREMVCANTLIRLTSRLLSLAVDMDVKRKASALLRRARTITLKWTRQVAALANTVKQSERDNLRAVRSRILVLAATCRATYDVDYDHLSSILSSDDDVATAVECSIMIQRNTPPRSTELPEWVCRLLERNRRLSSELESELRKLILASDNGINRAISQTGYSFTCGTNWSSKDSPNERWLFMETRGGDGKRAANVCYNLLDGLVLIDGSPLGRLPEPFTSHKTYSRTFGNVRLTPFPA